MSSKIPQDFIDEILSKTSIQEEISKRVTLKKAGHEYHGLCPFHNEKTPSFTVSPRKNFFYCFGCGASGNVISFIMKFEQREFRSTIENLAHHLGMKVPKQETKEYQKNHSCKQLLRQIQIFYTKELLKNPAAMKYLNIRLLSKETITNFAIGFAPAQNINWNNKLKQDYARNIIVASGISYLDDKNQLKSRFKGRVTFPIRNINGETIGFGARKINQEAIGPKYINSPETNIFKKSFELYGLYEAKQRNKSLEDLIVVEGYMDVISLYQNGVYNAVASLGTAINQNHIKTIIKHVQTIYFCFDGDNAGKKAAWKSLLQIMPLMCEKVHVYFMFLPEQEDPDSFITKKGLNAFLDLKNNSMPAVEFLFQETFAHHNTQTITGRSHTASYLFEIIDTIPNSIFKQLLEQEIEKRLAIPNKTAAPTITIKEKKHKYNDNIETIISMLLQEPEAAAGLAIPPLIAELNSNKVKWLKEIVKTCNSTPNLNTAILLRKWENHAAYDWLVSVSIEEHLLPNKLFKQNVEERINMLNNKLIDAKINAIIHDSKSRVLSIEEKEALNNLIKLKKN